MCHFQLKHQINTALPTIVWSFAAPSAVSLSCKSNYVLMFPRLKIVEKGRKLRNYASLDVSVGKIMVMELIGSFCRH